MAYALTGTDNSSGIPLVASFSAGETVLVGLTLELPNGAATFTVTDTVNTYVQVGGVAGVGAIAGTALFKADNVAAGTPTITATRTAGSATICGLSYFRYTGLAAGAEQTQAADTFFGGGGTTFSSSSLTPTSQPAMLFSIAADQNTTAPTVGAGFTDRGPISNAGLHPTDAEDKRLTSTSAVTGDWGTTATFDQYGLSTAIFSEASGAPLSGTLGQFDPMMRIAGWF